MNDYIICNVCTLKHELSIIWKEVLEILLQIGKYIFTGIYDYHYYNCA